MGLKFGMSNSKYKIKTQQILRKSMFWIRIINTLVIIIISPLLEGNPVDSMDELLGMLDDFLTLYRYAKWWDKGASPRGIYECYW